MSWYQGLEPMVRRSEPLAPYTWLRIGGSAEFFAEPASRDELAELVARARQHHVPVRILGGGSRLLLPDQGVPGLVLRLSAPSFCQIERDGHAIQAGAGAILGHVISAAVREGLAGLESLVGVPGTVGGAVRGNADGFGVSIGQWTEHVTVLTYTGQVERRDRSTLRFAYRQSNLDDLAILDARFDLEPGNSEELTRRMQKLWIVKRAAEPTYELGVARLFCDPPGVTAAELIEQVGLRGYRIGSAQISERNANFVVTYAQASTEDVRQLIQLVEQKVSEQLGIQLECELEVW